MPIWVSQITGVYWSLDLRRMTQCAWSTTAMVKGSERWNFHSTIFSAIVPDSRRSQSKSILRCSFLPFETFLGHFGQIETFWTFCDHKEPFKPHFDHFKPFQTNLEQYKRIDDLNICNHFRP